MITVRFTDTDGFDYTAYYAQMSDAQRYLRYVSQYPDTDTAVIIDHDGLAVAEYIKANEY